VADFKRKRPDDNWQFRPSGNGQPMLLVRQSAMQQRLLQKFGQVVVGLDATYKTNKWGFPLFLINIVTNHSKGYPVGLFFVEEENGDSIEEALNVLRTWNPGWRPSYIMIDKSDGEKNAVEAALAGVTVLLCDFHRLQAWWRWINDSQHGVGELQR
jgi:hypothetical protein